MSIDVQRFACPRGPFRRRIGAGGFTLAEVLAALLFMAILIPVTMQGVTVASRSGMLAQRKAAAARIAERVLDELIVTGQLTTGSGSGTVVEGSIEYPWTLRYEGWTQDAMDLVTVRVEFSVQGNVYDVAVSTLYDPQASTPSATATTGTTL